MTTYTGYLANQVANHVEKNIFYSEEYTEFLDCLEDGLKFMDGRLEPTEHGAAVFYCNNFWQSPVLADMELTFSVIPSDRKDYFLKVLIGDHNTLQGFKDQRFDYE